MCGIAGITGAKGRERIANMVHALSHRGPDGHGLWHGDGVSLGTHRLAIVDRENGEQPFVSDGLTLVCNGEIYNHQRLRTELQALGARFSTRCDVEVILHGYRIWGTDILTRLNGQFAFALWDEKRQELFLARDRFGIAPLVWTTRGGQFSFASEAKALLSQPEIQAEIHPGALHDFLSMRYAAEPRTFFQGIFHLMPGHFLRVRNGIPDEPRRWYHTPRSGDTQGETPSLEEATEKLSSLLEKAVARRRQGEVPVGLYLSGGLDSSVVGAIAKNGEGPLVSFSHGFDAQTDELLQARAANQAIGGELHEVMMTSDSFNALPAIIQAVEQPVANSDIIGLWSLAQRASTEVPVVLCGEGADEIFGSYPHQQLLNTLQELPGWVPSLGAHILSLTPGFLRNALGPYSGALRDPDGLQRLLTALRGKDLRTQYTALTGLFTPDEEKSLFTEDFRAASSNLPGARESMLQTLEGAQSGSVLDRLIDLKMDHWLPGYHLGRENRIAMAHGIEARYPFLDHEVVEFVLSLPPQWKTGGKKPREKRVLREVAKQILPLSQAMKPKGPVRVPLGLFGEYFSTYCHEYLSPERMARRGLFQPNSVANLIKRYDHSPFVVGRQLFALLMVELWHETFVDKALHRA